MQSDFNSFCKILNSFSNTNEAKQILDLGKDKRANIISRIPGTAYYNKVCISPRCNRTFEATIRGQYCNYAPSGEGSSCRQHVRRLKHKAVAYFSALNIIIPLILVAIFVYCLFNKNQSEKM